MLRASLGNPIYYLIKDIIVVVKDRLLCHILSHIELLQIDIPGLRKQILIADILVWKLFETAVYQFE